MTNQQMRLLALAILALAMSLVVSFLPKGRDIPELVLTGIIIVYAIEFILSIKDK